MPSQLEERARALAVAQDFGPEALDVNRRLVAANPADTASHTRLARCYLQAGRIDEAEAEYREALHLDPRNRIAAGGLEAIEQRRHPVEERRTGHTRVARAPRPRSEPSPSSAATSSDITEPVPQTFTGFGASDFGELAGCRRGQIQGRFAPRVIDLVRRVNALSSAVDMAGIREPGKRQLFRVRSSDVHAGQAHWQIFNLGGRWQAQSNLGMYAGPRAGNYLRIGIAFNMAESGADADAGLVQVRDHFRRFQEILASPRRSLFLGWMVKENGRLQCDDDGGPRLDVTEPSQAASLIAGLDPERTEWVFFGKWLRLEDADAATILVDPVSLVRTIDRVYMGLLPLWRALFEA